MAAPEMLHRLGLSFERFWDRIAGLFTAKRREQWEIGVQTYRTYGTPKELRFSCRVLRDPKLAKTTIYDSFWQNLKATFHQFESDEVAQAQLRITDSTTSISAVSDEEGYAQGALVPITDVPPGWQGLQISIDDLPYGHAGREFYPGECLIPSPSARFGIISDVDDTVMHSEVTRPLRMLLWSLTHNAFTRLPLPGAARLYRDLARTDHGDEVNPVFYVSSSPWNLYTTLVSFMDAVELPRGPLMLRDLGIGVNSSRIGDHNHKFDKIVDILETYPGLSFILLGDSGQHDAAIYSRIVQRYPGRIMAIYIRVIRDDQRRELQSAQQVAADGGCPMLLVSDSDEIASHARRNGWLTPRDRHRRMPLDEASEEAEDRVESSTASQ